MHNPDFNTFKKNEVDLSKKDGDYEKRDIDIYPCKISRRVLAYFADLIIALFASVFFFEMAVLPIGKLTSSYMEQAKNVSSYSNARVNILYQNNLLFFDDGEELNMQENLVTTSDEFTEFYVYDNSRVTSEVFYHYFCEIRDYDVAFLNNLYLKYGQDYLDRNNFTILGTYQFKEDVVNLFKPKFVPGDELSETGSTEYDHFQSVFFLNMYSEMLNDIKVNDLNPTIEMEYTYNGYTKLVDEFDVFYRNLITICAVISFFIATSVLNFLIPLINHKGRTISEMVLKIEHISEHRFRCIFEHSGDLLCARSGERCPRFWRPACRSGKTSPCLPGIPRPAPPGGAVAPARCVGHGRSGRSGQAATVRWPAIPFLKSS